jgi:hypothetical protein
MVDLRSLHGPAEFDLPLLPFCYDGESHIPLPFPYGSPPIEEERTNLAKEIKDFGFFSVLNAGHARRSF